MAPEYALNRHSDARTDLFSLGVMLYECLAGRRPFDGENDIETLERARRGEREPLAAIAPDTPKALTTAIESLLDPRPTNRPANAGLFLDALATLAPPLFARRSLGALVRRITQAGTSATAPGLASTRSVATQRPRKRLRSQH